MDTIKKCLQCGGDIIIGKNGIPTCKYCGTEYEDGVSGYSGALERIVEARQLREFIKAEEMCANLIAEQPESSEAHWQMLLATLGVVYVREESGTKPTFFSYSYDERESLEKNEWFKKTIELAKTASDRNRYEKLEKELNVILKEFFELTAKEKSYQVFISFKNEDDFFLPNGDKERRPTRDREKAEELFNALRAKRIKAFFSPVSIGGDTGIEGEKYEPRILKALQTAQVMVLFGTRDEYFNAPWVQNEWRRYKYFIDKGKKREDSLIIAYDPSHARIPAALNEGNIQRPTVNVDKDGYIKNIVDRIEKIVQPGSVRKKTIELETDFGSANNDGDFGSVTVGNHKEWQGSVRLDPKEERELQTAENIRANGQFADAVRQYDLVLKINGNNSKALWGKFCACVKAKCDAELKDRVFHATNTAYDILKKAMDWAPEEEYWRIVDLLLETFSSTVKFEKQKRLFDFIASEGIIVEKRNPKLLAILGNKCTSAVLNGKINDAEKIFACAERLFIKTNLAFNVEYTKNYAHLLLKKEYFDYALKYFNKLAAARNDAVFYLGVLQCRVRAIDITKVPFNLTGALMSNKKSNKGENKDEGESSPDNVSVEKLGIDDIIIRILVCDLKSKTPKLLNLMTQVVFNQILHNPKGADQFIGLYTACFDDLIKKGVQVEGHRESFLLQVAGKYIEKADFKTAKIYYDDVAYYNPNSFDAHFGLLKCRLKAFDDIDVEKKRKKLLSYDEFNNARTCANNEQYERLMSIYNGQATGGKNKSRAAKNREIKITLALISPIALLLAWAITMIASPITAFKHIHYGWAIAIYIIAFIASIIVSSLSLDIFKAYPHRKALLVLGSALALLLMIIGMTSISNKTIEISSVEEFESIVNLPKKSKNHYVLTNDIDFEGASSNFYGSIKRFYGVIDGDGHYIKDLNVSKESVNYLSFTLMEKSIIFSYPTFA